MSVMQHLPLPGRDTQAQTLTRAVMVGRSNILGKPMTSLLLNANCTVTALHSPSLNLTHKFCQADILVVATGRPLMIVAEHIKPVVIILDVGINRITDVDGNWRLAGDVDIGTAHGLAGAVTSVPEGRYRSNDCGLLIT